MNNIGIISNIFDGLLGKLRPLAAVILVGIVGFSFLPASVTRSDATKNTTAQTPPADKAMPNLQGDEAVEHLKQAGTYDSLQEAISAIKYEARLQEKPQLSGVGASYEVKNAANNLLAYVSADGIEATSVSGRQGSWRLGLKLKDFGYGEELSLVTPGEVTAKNNRVSIQRSAIRNPQSEIEEWFVNTSRGIEHGFTINARPQSASGDPKSEIKEGPLRLRFEVSGDLQVEVNSEGSGAAFKREADNVLLSYDKLFVVDAKGRAVAARMKPEAGGLEIEVEDKGAEYPLLIDPLLREQTRITASDGATNGFFGQSVAISGDTVVVGAQGSAYVFVRSGPAWTQQSKLTASDGAANDGFGVSAAISGDTVVVGAQDGDVGANANQGSAYVFFRSGTTWIQQAKLTASDGAENDRFGNSVAISGDTVVVGAGLANAGQGSAYVFLRSGMSWTQQAKLTASDGAVDDFFGTSVAISGDTVVVGAQDGDIGANANQGSAYAFVRSGTTWTQQAKLTASDGVEFDGFGFSVAISGETVVVGAAFDDVGANPNQGSAYVFVRSGISWNEQQKLTALDGAAVDFFGNSVAISGDTVVVGAIGDDVGVFVNQGSAHALVRSGTTWSHLAHLKASDGAADDEFGSSVGISGDAMVVGASGDDVGANNEQGSAYLYICNWDQQQQLTASDGAANDDFGFSVAISGDTVVVGAEFDDVGGSFEGSAYVFVRSGTTWAQQAKLTASDGGTSDQFGESVAINGDTVVVGADLDDVGANPDQGSAYVFVRSGTTWTQQAKLTASDGAANDQFGFSVAISGDSVAVGALADLVGANGEQGSAYVFVRSGTTWTQQAKVTASDGAENDRFGNSVAISGDTVVAGVAGANGAQGSAYVFVRGGTNWTQQAELTPSDGAAGDFFGQSVAISGDTVVVGAVGANAVQGAAYVFVRSGPAWTQQSKLTASDGAASDGFGVSAAISGDTVVVGAWLDDVGTNSNQGSAYVFVRSGIGWIERQKLTASDGAEHNFFGNSIAISGDTVVVGANGDDVGANVNQGSAYVFFNGCNTFPNIAASNVIRQKGTAATSAPLAIVDDGQDPIGHLTVSVVSAPTGISITGITNSNGVISAQVAALCSAALGNNAVLLRVQDSDGATSTATLFINVTANTAPTLGTFTNASVSVLGSTTVTPTAAPSDNGSIMSYIASSATFAGILTTDPDTGSITISNARPGGTHNINVTVIDNCGAAYSTLGFVLTVTCQTITVNPATIPGGTAGSTYNQVFTQTGGNGTATFSLTGALPTGMSFTSATATLSGTPTQVGPFPVTVTATDANNCSGSRNYTLVISAPLAVWNGSISSNWNTASNWTPNGVPASFNDVLIPTAGVTNQPTISAGSSSINAISIQSSRVLTINSSLQLSTAADVDVTSGGTITGAGKLAVSGASFNQNGSVSIASVEFTAGNHSLTGGGAFASGIATILSGASVTLTSDHSLSVLVINSGGSFDCSNQALTLTGAGTAIFNSGLFAAAGSTIIYQGSVAQVVTANIDYNNLTINNAAGVSLGAETTASGEINLLTDLSTGSFTLTMAASGTSAGIGDVVGNAKRTGFTNGVPLSFGNPLNTIRFDSGTPPIDVTVNLVKSTPPGSPANTVSRTYMITPNGGSGFSATLRLRYTDTELNGLSESTLELWRFNGSTWQSPAGSAARDTSENWVSETGVTAFSPWAIAGPSGPTEVKLISFDATGYDSGVLLEWQTGVEVDNLGFRVYRDEAGTRVLLNREIVAGSALTAGAGTTLTAGRAYALWVDPKDAGKDSAYWLEDIDLNGQSTWHGPVYAKQRGGKPPVRSQAESLSQVGQTNYIDATHAVEDFAQLLRSSQAGSSQFLASLASGRALKIGVRQAGWHRVTQAELIKAGLSPKTDPRTLRLFVDGKELPIFVAGEEDGFFDANDAVEFYGLGLNTPSTDTRVYWLISGGESGLRINTAPFAKGYPSGESFAHTVERRDRTIYFSALRNGDEENFFGAVVSGSALEQRVTLNSVALSARETASIEVSLQGVTTLPHQVSVSLNGSSIGRLVFNGQARAQEKIEVSQAMLQEGENILTFQSLNGPSDISLVDFIRITYQHSYRAENDWLSFAAGSGEAVTINGFSSKDVRVFDVTDERDVHELAVSIEQTREGYAGSVTISAAGDRKLLALTEGKSLRAENVKADTSSSLRQSSNAADFVIISQASLADSLKPLVDLRSKQGLITTLVDIEDIYDEFSFGNKSPQSVKDFLSYAAKSWKVKPRFVLFAADASYDARNYLGLGDNDLVPTKLIDTAYLETASDDWFVDFNDDGIADLTVGRLPIRAAGEASAVVSKLIAYEQSVQSNEVVLVADSNDGFDFEQASTSLRSLMPSSIRATEIYRSRSDDSTARSQLLAAINRGQKIVNYTGHGSVNVWRGNLLTASDGHLLTNKDRLSLFVMMTCLNGYFQDAMNESLGESLLKAETGGAVAVWASSAMCLPEQQVVMNQELYRLLFGPGSRALTLGEMMRQAKSAVSDGDIRRSWILLGDPTMRVK